MNELPAIEHLTSLINKPDGQIFARYDWEECLHVSKTLPVYTTAQNMTGKVRSSKNLRAVFECKRPVKRSEVIEVSKEQANILIRQAQEFGFISNENRDDGTLIKWVVKTEG